MFSEQDLSELVQFRSDGSPVLSLYLNVDPSQQSSDQHKLSVRSLLKEVAGEADSADIQAMERYFDFEYERQGKGLALFSCQDADFWRSYWLAVPVHNQAHVAPRPYIKPLTDVLDAYGRYAVVLVDSEGARMFLFQLGELAEASGIFGEEVRRSKHGGASGVAGMRGGVAPRAARKGEETVQRNLREVAEVTETFCQNNGCRRLVVGGSDANVRQLLDVLPKQLQDVVVGTFVVDLAAPVSDVQARSLELIERAAQERETGLVDDMWAGWKRGSGATVGLADTLAALQEHRVGTLLVGAGYSDSGYRCRDCRYLVVLERDECPLCGGHMDPVEDIVDTLTRRALEQGVEVEIVRGNPKLEEVGSVGALLRY